MRTKIAKLHSWADALTQCCVVKGAKAFPTLGLHQELRWRSGSVFDLREFVHSSILVYDWSFAVAQSSILSLVIDETFSPTNVRAKNLVTIVFKPPRNPTRRSGSVKSMRGEPSLQGRHRRESMVVQMLRNASRIRPATLNVLTLSGRSCELTERWSEEG